MSSKIYQILVVNLGVAILYAIQKKIAWKVADHLENTLLQKEYDRELEFRARPYPKPRKKNLYYRDTTDWE